MQTAGNISGGGYAEDGIFSITENPCTATLSLSIGQTDGFALLNDHNLYFSRATYKLVDDVGLKYPYAAAPYFLMLDSVQVLNSWQGMVCLVQVGNVRQTFDAPCGNPNWPQQIKVTPHV
jgi:hypothetical protein